MLACGRALVANPLLLMLDEPSEGLAPLLVREFENIMNQIKGLGFSLLLVEQNVSFALRLAHRPCITSRGVIVYQGRPEKLEANPEIRSRYLGV
jgi:branched-chain amino acid transport system ATP-binding protein